MKTLVRPESPFATRPESTYKSGKVVQTNGATSFLATHAERRSEKGAIRKSNVTDNDSAKMATAKGVIQGYTAVAAVDGQAQIIVAAQAHGSGSEQSVLLPMVEMAAPVRTDQTIVVEPMPAITAKRTCRACASAGCRP